MYCTKCGKEMQTADRFCASCGMAVPPPPGPPPGHRRLMRSYRDKKLAGVCAGIARANGWDVTLVRIAFLAAFLLHGVGLVAYIIAWIAMPSDEYEHYQPAR